MAVSLSLFVPWVILSCHITNVYFVEEKQKCPITNFYQKNKSAISYFVTRKAKISIFSKVFLDKKYFAAIFILQRQQSHRQTNNRRIFQVKKAGLTLEYSISRKQNILNGHNR